VNRFYAKIKPKTNALSAADKSTFIKEAAPFQDDFKKIYKLIYEAVNLKNGAHIAETYLDEEIAKNHHPSNNES